MNPLRPDEINDRHPKALRGSVLFFILLVSFASPAGSCASDLSVGFPLVAFHVNHVTRNHLGFFPIPLLINVLVSGVLSCLFYFFLRRWTRYQNRMRASVRGIFVALIYGLSSSWLCFLLMMQSIFWTHAPDDGFFAIPFYYAIWFYVPMLQVEERLRGVGIGYGDFWRGILEQGFAGDASSLYFRIGLLPALFFFWGLFTFLIWIWRQIKILRQPSTDSPASPDIPSCP